MRCFPPVTFILVVTISPLYYDFSDEQLQPWRPLQAIDRFSRSRSCSGRSACSSSPVDCTLHLSAGYAPMSRKLSSNKNCRWSRAVLKQSWKKLQADDFMMVATFASASHRCIEHELIVEQCCYTTLLVLLQFSCRYATNELDPSELSAVLANPQEVRDRIFGSKIVIGTNQCYLLTLWGVKACLLTL